MKKRSGLAVLISGLLVIVLALGMVGCGDKKGAGALIPDVDAPVPSAVELSQLADYAVQSIDGAGVIYAYKTMTEGTTYAIYDTNTATLQTSDQGSGVMGYFYYIWGDGIDVSFSGQNITPTGQGDMLVLGLFGPKTLGDRPEATFVMGDIFGVVYEDKNIAMPANPLPLSQGISPLEGCWYTYLRTTSNAATVDYWAGAMPSVGSVTTSNDGDIHKVVVDFVDRNGNKITGTYEGELLDNGSAAGGFYMPSFPISAELANPVLRAYRK